KEPNSKAQPRPPARPVPREKPWQRSKPGLAPSSPKRSNSAGAAVIVVATTGESGECEGEAPGAVGATSLAKEHVSRDGTGRTPLARTIHEPPAENARCPPSARRGARSRRRRVGDTSRSDRVAQRSDRRADRVRSEEHTSELQ